MQEPAGCEFHDVRVLEDLPFHALAVVCADSVGAEIGDFDFQRVFAVADERAGNLQFVWVHENGANMPAVHAHGGGRMDFAEIEFEIAGGGAVEFRAIDGGAGEFRFARAEARLVAEHIAFAVVRKRPARYVVCERELPVAKRDFFVWLCGLRRRAPAPHLLCQLLRLGGAAKQVAYPPRARQRGSFRELQSLRMGGEQGCAQERQCGFYSGKEAGWCPGRGLLSLCGRYIHPRWLLLRRP